MKRIFHITTREQAAAGQEQGEYSPETFQAAVSAVHEFPGNWQGRFDLPELLG